MIMIKIIMETVGHISGQEIATWEKYWLCMFETKWCGIAGETQAQFWVNMSFNFKLIFYVILKLYSFTIVWYL